MGVYLVVAAQSLSQASAGAGLRRPDTIITVHLQTAAATPAATPPSTARASPQAEAPAPRQPSTPAAFVQATPAAVKPPIATEGRDGKVPALHAAAHPPTRRPTVAVGGVTSAFQVELLAHIEQYRAYPAAAVPAQLHGVVQVLFAMTRDGTVTGVWVKSGSGYAVLDDAAMQTIWRSQPLPPIPSDLPQHLTVLLPVAFSPPP